MMRQLLVVLMMVVCSAAANAVETVTPAMIKEAIQAGMTNPAMNAGYKIDNLGVVVLTPYSRIAKAASDAKRKYRPFTAAHVTKDMIRPTITVVAPGMMLTADSRIDIEHVVVAKGSDVPRASVASAPLLSRWW